MVGGLDGDDDEALAVVALAAGLRHLGWRIATMTPRVDDARQVAGRWRSPGLDRLAAADSFAWPASALCARIRPAAVPSPDPPLRGEEVVDLYRALATWADAVLVQGSGGLTRPLAPGMTLAHIAARLRLPTVLVLQARTAVERLDRVVQALEATPGMALAGWIAIATGPSRRAERLGPVSSRIGIPLLGLLDRGDGEAAGATLAARRAASRLLRASGGLPPPGLPSPDRVDDEPRIGR